MKAKIFLVDDDPDMRELLGSILSLNGYDVSKADCGAAVREALGREHPDIVLLDYKLPETPGREPTEIGLALLPLLKREWPEAEVIHYLATPSGVRAVRDLSATPRARRGKAQRA